MTTMISPSVDQNKIKILCDTICDDIDRLMDHFNLEYKRNSKFISLSCPIHGGDNPGAINIYPDGERYRGNWKCRTHQCEKVFMGSIIGFIRGILSRNNYEWEKEGDKTASFAEALRFASDFVNLDLEEIKVNKSQKNKQNFISQVSLLKTSNEEESPVIHKITRAQIRKSLKVPSNYFLSRGFSTEILDKYDVGDCLNTKKEMFDRAVVPIYDNNHKNMIGCTGRAIHNIKPKWKHSDGFRAENCLYNFWYAKEHIKKMREVILVESPGNVWALESHGIHNSLAMFGSNLSDKQKMILDISGAMTIIVLTDSDEAGEAARSLIEKKCSKIYNIKHIRVSANDVAELTPEQIQIEIKDKLV
jgi:DNA primase